MKNKTIICLVIAVLLTANFSASSAQGKSKSKQEEVRTRAMFINKKADGLEVKLTNEKRELLDPGKAFKAGDKIRIQFTSNFSGYVYFVNVAPSGVTKVIHVEAVDADKEYFLPSKDPIEFDKEVGTEILKIVMSYERIQLYEDARKNSDGELGKSASSVAEELADNGPKKGGKKPAAGSKPPGEAVGIVTSNNTCGRERGLVLASGQEARCRSLVLASGNQAKNEGSVVAISDKQGTKLQTGEVAVFELRLKHM